MFINVTNTKVEVIHNNQIVKSLPIKPFEHIVNNLAVLKAVEFVRESYYNNATFYDFSQIIRYN